MTPIESALEGSLERSRDGRALAPTTCQATITLAALHHYQGHNSGYRNTTVESNGRQAHIAAIDPERADLITWAFTAYATGDHTLKSLAAELNARGLTVPATANMPERPISIQSLHRMLSNPFYTGQIVYRGGLYPGTHQAVNQDRKSVV